MLEQFDVSEAQKKILLEKTKRRAVLREEFLKQSSNPFRHASMEGGAVFDSAISRFIAMEVSTYEHFRPTAKTVFGLLAFMIPMGLYGYAMKATRDMKEQEYRRGEVAYSDRKFKFV